MKMCIKIKLTLFLIQLAVYMTVNAGTNEIRKYNYQKVNQIPSANEEINIIQINNSLNKSKYHYGYQNMGRKFIELSSQTIGTNILYLRLDYNLENFALSPFRSNDPAQISLLSNGAAITLPYKLTDEISGNTYGFHLLMASLSSTIFKFEIILERNSNQYTLADTTSEIRGTTFKRINIKIKGLDLNTAKGDIIILKITRVSGVEGGILCNGLNNADSYIEVPYFNYDNTKWEKYLENPIIDLGMPEEWDTHDLLCPCIILANNKYQMFYSGRGGVWQVGLTVSSNGLTWNKVNNNPILVTGHSGEWDDNGVVQPFVIFHDNVFKMWYAGSDGFNWRIGYATSTDGVVWHKFTANPILDVGQAASWDEATVARPSVIIQNNEYRMWYVGKNNKNEFNIGYATSYNGFDWIKYENNPVLESGFSDEWDSIWVSQPLVIFDGQNYLMWYTGYDGYNMKIGKAVSADGINWIKHENNPILYPGISNSWDEIDVSYPNVIYDNSTFKMWYIGNDGANSRIGYATKVKTQVNVFIPDTAAASGDTITVPVIVSDVSRKNILSAAIFAETNSNILIPLEASTIGSIAETWGEPTTNISDGRISLAMAGTSPLIGSGPLAYINYIVNPSAVVNDTTTIHIENVIFNEGEPDAITNDGIFRVIGTGVPIIPIAPDTVFISDEFWIDISIGSSTHPVNDLKIVSFELEYTNTDIVDYVSYEIGSFLSGAQANVIPDDQNGTISASVYRFSGGNSGNGTLLRLKFKVSDSFIDSKNVSFNFSALQAHNSNGNEIGLLPERSNIAVLGGIPVWPGDANNDSQVSIFDINQIVAVHWNKTGPKRVDASIEWKAQLCLPWDPFEATYSDCNGNGNIDIFDINSVVINFGKTHESSKTILTSAKIELYKSSVAPPIFLEPRDYDDITDCFWLDVKIGTVDLPINDLKVASFELNYSNCDEIKYKSYELGNFPAEAQATVVADDTTRKLSASIYRINGGDNGSGTLISLKFNSEKGNPVDFAFNGVLANNSDGDEIVLTPMDTTIVTSIPAIAGNNVPDKYYLFQNYPNPFNPETIIHYQVPSEAKITLRVFNLNGQLVKTLLSEIHKIGDYSKTWDGKDESGNILPSGVYFYQLKAQAENTGENFMETRKMVLVR
ncbi:MAG: T9SS type A sorting domain-containing protein [Candidatus Lokiarchaeota archaeon]|nr:T9SS type A sorting domain-containing protein [Candidatus Lokiarchaeota archaeon]